MNAKENQRTFTRVGAGVVVEIETDDGATTRGALHDLSMNGMYVANVRGLSLGAACRARLLLDAGGESIPIRVEGRVSRADPAGAAIEFESVDADGLPHLRNLILYNTRTSGQVEREMARAVGIKRTRRPAPGGTDVTRPALL